MIKKCSPKNSVKKLLQAPITPESTIIAFDIHGVLFKKDYKKIARIVLHNKKQVSTLLLYTLNPFFIFDVLKLLYKKAVTEEYIIGLSNKYSRLSKLIPLGIAVANAQKPIPQTINIAKKLKTLGYTLHIVSNIGKTIYDDLAAQHPAIFSNFDAIITPSTENNYQSKSHKAFFDSYFERYARKNQLFLIDDKARNIKTAAQSGIAGITFTQPKKLQKELAKLSAI